MTSITAISATDFSSYDGGSYTNIKGVASSSNGNYIYVAIYNVTSKGIISSTNNGGNWFIIDFTNISETSMQFTSIACSYNGNVVYAPAPTYSFDPNVGNGIYKSTNAGYTWYKQPFTSSGRVPGGLANPESQETGVNATLSQASQIACDSSGSKLFMTTKYAASLYQSVNGGSEWTFLYAIPGSTPNASAQPTCVASNDDGTILYAAANNTSSKNILVSKDSGTSWTSITMQGIIGPFGGLGCNSFGDIVFATNGTSSLNIFYPTNGDKAVLVPTAGATLTSLGVYNSGNRVVISQNIYGSIANGAVVVYSVAHKYIPGKIPCFKSDSKILCFKEGAEVYVKIQDIRKGDLVKTLNNGYVAVNMIGKKEINHPGSKERIKDQLYKCSSSEYPELFEPLIITGCHAILVDNFANEEQKEKVIELYGKLYITDNKYRLPACADLRASVYETTGTYSVYHLALENDAYYMNYGIYANGLLVETCSKRYLKELSNMALIE